MWQVVGGTHRGLLVRDGPELDAQEDVQRLQCGALLREVECQGQRLKFHLLAGQGPLSGWDLDLGNNQLEGPRIAASGAENGIQALSATELELYCMLHDMGITVPCLSVELAAELTATVQSAVVPATAAKDEERAAWIMDLPSEFDAYDFLLDPYQRRAFNEVHGFLTPTVNVAWWSDWDDIFAEIEVDAVDAAPALGTQRAELLLMGATGITGTLACMDFWLHQHWRTFARLDPYAVIQDGVGGNLPIWPIRSSPDGLHTDPAHGPLRGATGES
eukprot:s825_g14.t1